MIPQLAPRIGARIALSEDDINAASRTGPGHPRKWIMSLLVPSRATIGGSELPRTYYQVLEISPDEQDPRVIEEAALVRSVHVRAYQLKHESESTSRLKEIADALITLLDPVRRREYDRSIGNSPRADVVEIRPSPRPVTPVVPRRQSTPPVRYQDALMLLLDEGRTCDLKLVYQRCAS
jgi:hypothetical protein